MIRRLAVALPASLLALVAPVLAHLPYNPTRIVIANNGSLAYLFSPQPPSSQFSLSVLDTSDTVNSSTQATTLLSSLPFLSSTKSRAFIPLPDREGISVLAGDCQDSSKGLELWQFTPEPGTKNGTWIERKIGINDEESLSADYLSAGFAFSPSASAQDASLYIFGGMCPDSSSNTTAANWVSDATYSNTMLTLSPDFPADASSPYELSITGSRAPPIAEAGLSIIPLLPTFSNTSETNGSQQQNFVLLGGHTQNAFINMSQVALFSLPQESWAFVDVGLSGESHRMARMTRDTSTVEPRSGHTAVLTEDGSRIVVLGGWVGDLSTAATPQLVVLEIAQGYGGQGNWAWTIPNSPEAAPFGSGQGIYGHGAAMLPGGVMVVGGGYEISQSTEPGQSSRVGLLFLNTTAMTWADSYTNPNGRSSSAQSVDGQQSSGGLKRSEKAGLGAGLGLGLAVATGAVIVLLLYSRRLRARRAIRERELRELALGSEKFPSPSLVDGGLDDHRYPQMRTASWGNVQERQIESSGHTDPRAPAISQEQSLGPGRTDAADPEGNGLRQAERTGAQMDVPSPTRGLRKNVSSRAPTAPGGSFPPRPGGAPGAVFRIDEEDEGGGGNSNGSIRRTAQPSANRSSVYSDPFKDPPPALAPAKQDEAAEQRKKEVQGWMEDWQSVAESMNLSRSPSQAHSRTYSNLSQFQSPAHGGDHSGRGSPEKSDRTGSTLSDRSMMSSYSLPGSAAGTVSRNLSQRSASAGYALLSSAVNRMTGPRAAPADHGANSNIVRAPSHRTVSLTTNPTSDRSRERGDRDERFSSARINVSALSTADQVLLNRIAVRPGLESQEHGSPPESPSKDKYARAGSLTSSGRKALTLLGSFKRVFTGTGNVDVQDRVATFESQSGQSSPTKHSSLPLMSENIPKRTLSAGAAFWRGKRGAKDWEEDGFVNSSGAQSSRIGRKPVPGQVLPEITIAGDDDEDWDVETAVQRRVVQVMFTVPKEKLRVVNADALSLLSSNRSEADHEEDKDGDHQIKRMSSVREGDEEVDVDVDHGGKGKEKERG